MLHLPETAVFYSFPLSQSQSHFPQALQCHTRCWASQLSSPSLLCQSLFLSPSVFLCVSHSSSLSLWVCFSFDCADRSVCGRECDWEPDRVRVREWAGPAQCRGFLYDDVRGEEPAPSSFLLYFSPLSSPLLPLLPCAWPRLLLEHRKGGREIIGRAAANKWAKAVWVNRQEWAKFAGFQWTDILK